MDSWIENYARTCFVRGADTAHDLKTPLNIAVLNLELLRMRMEKLGVDSTDPKIVSYSAAIEGELRRLAVIIDAYFFFSTPPKDCPDPEIVDAAELADAAARRTGMDVRSERPLPILANAARIQKLFELLLTGVSRICGDTTVDSELKRSGDSVELVVRGAASPAAGELEKVFKFYYTDTSGNPELSLATARLIAETLGGSLRAEFLDGQATFVLAVPAGEQ